MARKKSRQPRPEAGPGEVTGSASCLTEFYSAVARKTIPAEFSRGFGLPVSGEVAAGFLPNGFAFPPPPGAARGILQSDATWSRGATIRVAFLDGSTSRKEQVETFAKQWFEQSGAEFRFEFGAPRGSSQVRVTFRGQGFWSRIGREADQFPGQATLTLSFRGDEEEAEVHRLVLHEFGHSLGFMHEHKHPEAGIQWDRQRALAYYRPRLPPTMSDAEIWDQLVALPRDSFRYKFYPFDPLSVMLYMVPKEAVVPGTWKPEFGNNNQKLSQSDMAIAVEAYGGKKPQDGGGGNGNDKRKPIKLGGSATGKITRDGQVQLYAFTAPSDDAYEITTEGDAIVHVDLTDAKGKSTKPNDPGEDSISPQVGVFMLRLLDKGDYNLKVTASRFAPLSEGQYAISVRRHV
jgi:serralysin